MKLVKAIWNEVEGKWKLQLVQGKFILEDEADVLLDGSGILNQWRWPDIEGLHMFKGKLAHTAQWDPEYHWEGKRIVVIGNGSSGVQVIPSFSPTQGCEAGELYSTCYLDIHEHLWALKKRRNGHRFRVHRRGKAAVPGKSGRASTVQESH